MCQTFVATGSAQTKDEEGSRSKPDTVNRTATVAADNPQFQYRVAHPEANESEEQTLNKLGKEGWELVAVVDHDDSRRTTFYLKRALRE